jgi:hypothetical protein
MSPALLWVSSSQEDPLKRFLTGAALLPLVMACGAARPATKEPVASTDTVRPVVATYAIGTSVTHEGAITADSAGDSFRRGPEIYLAVDVASASTEQTINVQWIDAIGTVAHQETRVIKDAADYADFATGDTTSWKAGPYRAVIRINDRVVNETHFALM